MQAFLSQLLATLLWYRKRKKNRFTALAVSFTSKKMNKPQLCRGMCRKTDLKHRKSQWNAN